MIQIKNHKDAAPAVLLNQVANDKNHWIRLVLKGSKSNRDAIGARVAVKVGNRTLVRHIKGGGSYLSAHDPRLLIGLGKDDRVDDVEVRWPNAKASSQHFGPLLAEHNYRLIEGADKAVEDRCPPSRTK